MVIGKNNYQILSDGGRGYFVQVGKDWNVGYLFDDGKTRIWSYAVSLYGNVTNATNHCLWPTKDAAQAFVNKCLAAKKKPNKKPKAYLREVFRAGNGLWSDSLTPDKQYLYLNKTTNRYTVVYWVNFYHDTKWSMAGWHLDSKGVVEFRDWDGRNERVWELPCVKYDPTFPYAHTCSKGRE